MSIHFFWEKLGIGLSDFYMESTDSAGQKYELNNQSLDLSYNFSADHPLSLGIGTIVDGEAKSSALNAKSTEVSGNRLMFFIGNSVGNWEFFGGYQFSTFEYKNFTSTENLNMTSGLIVFGIGVRF